MAHYAFLDENNTVTEIIVGVDEDVVQIDSNGLEVGGSTEAWEIFYGNLKGKVCKRTSINTINGEHLQSKTPFRKTCASVGGTYNEELDAFIPAKPFPSWQFDETTCTWNVPVSRPEVEPSKYVWNEETISWVREDI